LGDVGRNLLDLDAGGQFERVVEAIGAELFHLFLAHHADRLRGFLDLKVQVGRTRADAVGALGNHQHLLERRVSSIRCGGVGGLRVGVAGEYARDQDCRGLNTLAPRRRRIELH
jgi:hypothetical protein